MSNISDVIAWKFNNQEGMTCRTDKNGVFQIIEFPGGIPSQAEQDAWTQEYLAWVSAGGLEDQDTSIHWKENPQNDKLILAFYNLDSRVRVLEGKPAIDKPTFWNGLLNYLRNKVFFDF